MNFKKFINSAYLKSNPLCGIGTYKDELNLATGVCTRKIKKLVLTGEEDWSFVEGTTSYGAYYRFKVGSLDSVVANAGEKCTHYQKKTISSSSTGTGFSMQNSAGYNGAFAAFRPYEISPESELTTWKTYLASQYANGTPVAVWYVLATPTTETITVPSGLSGIVEGSLTQTGTPTPSNPIYPTANTVEQWFDINHYIMGTSTDTLTALPAVLYPNDTTATVGVKGNTVQNGTPTPADPITPQGVGERTANLFDVSATDTTNGYIANSYLNANGEERGSNYYNISEYIDISGLSNINISGMKPSGSSGSSTGIGLYDNNKILITSSDYAYGDVTSKSFSVPSNAKYIRISYNKNLAGGAMLNSGSTALPYEPYGYKLPITCGDTTMPVHLGEVQSTRRIKKLVLTGEETITNVVRNRASNGNCYVYKYEDLGMTDIINYDRDMREIPYPRFLSTHLENKPEPSGIDPYTNIAPGEIGANSITANLTYNRFLILCLSGYEDKENFQEYLAQQYANGSPVTIWYVLAEPETGIVNEQLMKIEEYADEVSNVSVPIAAGANTFSVDTTLQSSKVTVNYKGWHPVPSVHEYDSNYTIATMQALTIAQLQTHTISELQGGEWS